MNSTKIKPWSVRHIEAELRESFAACGNAQERDIWRIHAVRKVLRIIGDRPCTPAEYAILHSLDIWVSNMSQPVDI